MSIFGIIILCLAIWIIGGMAIYVIDFYTAGVLSYDYEVSITISELLTAGCLGICFFIIVWIGEYGKSHGWFSWFVTLTYPIFKRKPKTWKVDPDNTGSL